MHCTHMDACANRTSQHYQANTGDLFGKFLENYKTAQVKKKIHILSFS